MSSNDLLKLTLALALASSVGCGDDTDSNGGGGGNGGGTTVATTGSGPSSVASTAASTASSTTTSTSSGDGGSDVGGSGSGGEPGEGGSGGAGGEEPAVTRGGAVEVRHFERAEPDDDDVVDFAQGFFYALSGFECSRVEDGACWFEHCHPADGASYTTFGAGTVTLEGTTPELELEPDEDGAYAYAAESPMFEVGDAVGIVVEGDVAPGFSLDLVAPAVATVTSPPMGDMVIDRSEDLDLAWDVEGDAAQLGSQIQVRMLDLRNTDSYEVHCLFPMADGEATIPSSMLAGMPDDNGTTGGFFFEDAAVESLDVDGWLMEGRVLRTSLSSEAPSGLAQAEVTWE